MLARLRRHLAGELVWLRIEGWEIRVEDVRLDASGSAHMLEKLLRDEARLRYLFG